MSCAGGTIRDLAGKLEVAEEVKVFWFFSSEKNDCLPLPLSQSALANPTASHYDKRVISTQRLKMTGRMAAMVCATVCAMAAGAASAQTAVGQISVCYYSTECAFANVPGIVRPPNAAQLLRDSGEHTGGGRAPTATSSTPVDAPAFQIVNTGTVAISAASFTIEANKKLGVVRDTFHSGTIRPGKSFVIVPGASNDKKTHPTGGIFTFNAPGSPLDTSDSGPDDNALKFVFNGKVGTASVTSGVIEPGSFLKPSTDGTVASLNFLGGPGNADGPCNDCYPVTVLANIAAPSTPRAQPGK